MKVLIITNKDELDGIGTIAIAKLMYENVEYITCSTFEVTELVKQKIADKTIYDYDKIYITDMCIKEPVLTRIDDDMNLREKLLILDHHLAPLEEGNDKYDFVEISLERMGVKECSTRQLYFYGIANDLIKKDEYISKFVEDTRQYATWEWEKNKNKDSKNLNIILKETTIEYYLEMINEIIKNKMQFRNSDLEVLKKEKEKTKVEIEDIIKSMIVLDDLVDGYRVGFINSKEAYKNIIPEHIKKNNVEKIDIIGMITVDSNTVLYRSITGKEVFKIPVLFGGKGSKNAGMNFKTNLKFREYVLDRIEFLKKEKAENFCIEVEKLAKKYKLPFFIVTENATAYKNDENEKIKMLKEYYDNIK